MPVPAAANIAGGVGRRSPYRFDDVSSIYRYRIPVVYILLISLELKPFAAGCWTLQTTSSLLPLRTPKPALGCSSKRGKGPSSRGLSSRGIERGRGTQRRKIPSQSPVLCDDDNDDDDDDNNGDGEKGELHGVTLPYLSKRRLQEAGYLPTLIGSAIGSKGGTALLIGMDSRLIVIYHLLLPFIPL